jgi:short-subunit dehydrogenase
MITGASNGLGAALARFYAAGGTHLWLWGRSEERLAQVADECRERGASVGPIVWDLSHVDGLASRIAELDRERPIELAIFNAGLGGTVPTGQIVETVERAHEIATVNFTAAVVGATAAATAMLPRRRGQIVLVGSLAESFPFPIAPIYAATKAGLKTFAEALGIALKPHGIVVTLVSPGFVDTAMSQLLSGPKPLMITPDEAAGIIAKGLLRRTRRIFFPWPLEVLRLLYLALPRPLRHAIMRRVTG